MNEGDIDAVPASAPWSSPCYVLASMELHKASDTKKSSKEEAEHCLVRAVMLLQQNASSSSSNMQHGASTLEESKVTHRPPPAKGAESCDQSPLDGATSLDGCVADGVISSITVHGSSDGTLTLKADCVRVHGGGSVLWEFAPHHVTTVAALGADGGLVLVGGRRPDPRRAVALRLPTRPDTKTFIGAFQTCRKKMLPPKQEQMLQQGAGAPPLTTEHIQNSDEPHLAQAVSTEHATNSKRMEKPPPLLIPEQKFSSNALPVQNSSESQDLMEPSTPTSPPPKPPGLKSAKSQDLMEPSTPTSPPPKPPGLKSAESQDLMGPSTPTSPPPKPPGLKSAESQDLMEPSTPISPPPKPPGQKSAESQDLMEPSTPTSPPPKPPGQKSAESQDLMEPSTPTSPPPKPPGQKSAESQDLMGPSTPTSPPPKPPGQKSAESQDLMEPSTPNSLPPKPPGQKSARSQGSMKPLTRTSPSLKPPVPRSYKSPLSKESFKPTSSPPKPPGQCTGGSSNLLNCKTEESTVIHSGVDKSKSASRSYLDKSRLFPSDGPNTSSAKGKSVHTDSQSMKDISARIESLLQSPVSSLAETKGLENTTGNMVPKGQKQMKPKREVSDKFQNHSKQFIEDELVYCDNLKKLLALRAVVKDDGLSMFLTLLAKILKVHEQIINTIVGSERRPWDYAQAFLDHQKELSSYVDLIRVSTVVDSKKNEVPEGYMRMIAGKMQSIRLKPHHYTLTLESWLKFVSHDEKIYIERAIGVLKKISKDADAFLLVDAVKGCPYNLSFHFPLHRYGDYKVAGKGFQSQQKYMVLLMTDIIVFTTSSGTKSFECVDAIRLEHVLIKDSKEEDTFIVDVNYGERRGRESIEVRCSTNNEACDWRRAIVNMRLEYAKKIIHKEKNDLAVRVKSMISARELISDESAGNSRSGQNYGTASSRTVDLARQIISVLR